MVSLSRAHEEVGFVAEGSGLPTEQPEPDARVVARGAPGGREDIGPVERVIDGRQEESLLALQNLSLRQVPRATAGD